MGFSLTDKPQVEPTTYPIEGQFDTLQWSPAFAGVIIADLIVSELVNACDLQGMRLLSAPFPAGCLEVQTILPLSEHLCLV